MPNDKLTDDEERDKGVRHETTAQPRSSSFGRAFRPRFHQSEFANVRMPLPYGVTTGIHASTHSCILLSSNCRNSRLSSEEVSVLQQGIAPTNEASVAVCVGVQGLPSEVV